MESWIEKSIYNSIVDTIKCVLLFRDNTEANRDIVARRLAPELEKLSIEHKTKLKVSIGPPSSQHKATAIIRIGPKVLRFDIDEKDT